MKLRSRNCADSDRLVLIGLCVRVQLLMFFSRLGGIANTIAEVIPRRLSAIPALMDGIRAGGDLVARLRDAELTACVGCRN
jgi:hypothetical protein